MYGARSLRSRAAATYSSSARRAPAARTVRAMISEDDADHEVAGQPQGPTRRREQADNDDGEERIETTRMITS